MGGLPLHVVRARDERQRLAGGARLRGGAARPDASPAGEPRARLAALAVGLGAAAKFAPLALAPLFARRGATGVRAPFSASPLAVAVLPFVPDGGLRELYDRTVGYQAGRPSPFSVWGQADRSAGCRRSSRLRRWAWRCSWPSFRAARTTGRWRRSALPC